MQKWSIPLLIAALISVATPAFADSPNNPAQYECSLSGSPSNSLNGCPNNNGSGTGTSATALTPPAPGASCQDPSVNISVNSVGCGADSNTITPVAPIMAFNTCYWVFNTSGTTSNFVPFGGPTDWNAFTSNYPPNIQTVPCSLPAGLPGNIGGNAIDTYTYTPPTYPVLSATLYNPPVYGFYTAPAGSPVAVSAWPTSATPRPSSRKWNRRSPG